ncbi:helix-turn-helix domain-containing protein [Telmatospirillum sp. J64-1]|uniref:helix-turn-helix domain-containing protein n=1 Tax=Telmatospirillum sp. J64-1 TaxID=2502183 RepID=UPI00115D19D5|nr:helix-turn-helix domain-containing protein [Telmatospirillum sp. J64-1]
MTVGASIPGQVPHFALYGEPSTQDDADFFHVEDVRSRSRLYDWAINPHTHKGLFQTVLIVEGEAETRLDDQNITLGPLSLVGIPSSTVHAFRFRPETEGYVLTMAESILFRDARTQALFQPLFQAPQVIDLSKTPQNARRVVSTLEHIMTEFQWPMTGRSLMVEWLLQAFLLLLVRQVALQTEHSLPERLQADLFSRFKILVEAHYQHHWPVARYARELGVTESRLNRLCKALAGRSAFKVIQDRLLLEARRKLTYIAAPVSLLAYELGFEDPAYFSRFFKKHTGLTPAEYRRIGTS